MAYLGSANSEDALTWNVFRSLQKAQRLDIVADWLRVEICKPRAMLIWCLAPELTNDNPKLQFQLGDLLRNTDGMIPGQIGEPDVVIQGAEGIVVIECKLGELYKPLAHLWEGRSLQQVKKRLSRYQQDVPNLMKDDETEADVMPMYQLVRMAYYAIRLRQICKRRPTLVSLGNKSNWSLQIRKCRKSPVDLWDIFLSSLGSIELHCTSTNWQSLLPLLEGRELDYLHQCLSQPPCLRCQSE
ncbi:hypothetical protein ES703_93199 [subsurface metagenome]